MVGSGVSAGAERGGRRVLSLDALRGLAILGMVLSGSLPYLAEALPAWMYHAQMPPPTHGFDPSVVGMTWVDVVFPLFLFALGAAVPLALSARLEGGGRRRSLVPGVFWRGVLLLFFALFKNHFVPSALREQYGTGLAYGISMLAFVVLFAVFTRFPRGWPGWLEWVLRLAGWGMALVMLASTRYADGSGFSVYRHDIILVILANVAVTTPLIWMYSPKRYTFRICVMVLVLCFHGARNLTNWGPAWTDLGFLRELVGERVFGGVIWACHPAYQKYLLLTIPGTIAGDILVTWMRPAAQRLSFRIRDSRWGELGLGRCVVLGLVCVGVVVGNIVGLGGNDLGLAVMSGAVLCGVGFVLLYSPPSRRLGRGRSGGARVSALLFRALFGWGVAWLVLGLLLYPYQGGIRKDPPTLSYFFVCAGLANFVLVAFAVVTDALHRPRSLGLLVANGQNPMIAYVAGSMFVVPVLELVPVGGGLSLLGWVRELTPGPWPGFWRGVGLTFLVAVFVAVLTRLRVVWRT